MIFSGHCRSLRLLRSSSDESLTTSQDTERNQGDRQHTSPQTYDTSWTEKTAPWFTPKAPDKEPPETEPSMQSQWPNGPPPSAPRSHRIPLSPPATRRFSNENEHGRRFFDHGATALLARQSFPSSVQWRKNDTLPTGSSGAEHSPHLRGANIPVSTRNTGKAGHDPDIVVCPSMMATTMHSLDRDRSTGSALSRADCGAEELDMSESPMLEMASIAQSHSSPMHMDAAETPQSERLFKFNSLSHFSPPQSKQQNGHLDETSSVVSDLTMSSGAAVSGRSSTISSSRTRTCHRCKKVPQAISPLFKCSQCPRRYHPHCAVPKILTSRQACGTPDWICKHCVKNFPENNISATGALQSIPQKLADGSGAQRESSPEEQEEREDTTARHYKGSYESDMETMEGKINLAEGTSHGQPKAAAASRNINSQHLPFNTEQRSNSGHSASHLDDWISEAGAMGRESMRGISSAPVSNSYQPPPRQVSSEQYGSIEDIRTHSIAPPYIISSKGLSESLGKAVTVTQPTSFKSVETNGNGQDQIRRLGTKSSFDTSMHTRNRTSHVLVETDDSEDDMSISPEKPVQKIQSSSIVMTTGRLQQRPETFSSKIETQPSKRSLKHLTCHHWKQRGGCRYREDECQYAHYDTGMDEGKNTTCFWWWNNGHCKKSERECLYAHRDTGIYAKPPPGYVPQHRLPIAPRLSDTFTRNSRADHYSPPPSPKEIYSPVKDLSATRSPSLPRNAAVSSSIPHSSSDRPTMSNNDETTNDRLQQKAIGVDPRLARRPSSMSVQDSVGDSETFLKTSKPDVNVTSTAAPADPITPAPGSTNDIDPSTSFNKCRSCEKKVFGSASLCFTCKGIKPARSKAVVKPSPIIPDTPELDTEMNTEVDEQPPEEVIPLTSPGKPAQPIVNLLKRTNSVLESGVDASMFITKKARVFKPSELRRTSGEMSPPQMTSPSVRDKPIVPPRPSAAVGGIMTKTPVPLEELIELERLRKQVVLLEKSNAEEKKAHDKERRLRAEEKDRADKLSEELHALKVRDREMRKLSQEEQKRIVVQANQGRKEQGHSSQDDTARIPQLAKRSKIRPNHVPRRSSNDFDRPSEANIQSPLRSREIRTDKDEVKVLRDMKARGIVFESDNESDDGPEVLPPAPFKRPNDPLWRPPKSSRDLFEVAPKYQQENLFFDLEMKKKEIAARPSRKQTFGRVLALSGRERGTVKVHREVDRCLPSRIVRTMVLDASHNMDPFKEVEETKEVEMTFEEFLGVPKNALLCLTTTQQLAYRDGALDRWGKLPRVPDDEKFDIGTKGV